MVFSSPFLVVVFVVFGCCSPRATQATALQNISGLWVHDNPMPLSLSDLSASAYQDSIYLAGGCDGFQTYDSNLGLYICSSVSSRVWKNNPENDTYEQLPTMPRPRYRHCAVVVNGYLYLIGGRDFEDNAIAEVDVFGIDATEWMMQTSSLPIPVSDQGCFAIGNTIYVPGGYDAAYNSLATVQTINVTIPSSLTFGNASSMNVARGDHAAVASQSSGVGYVLGGWTSLDNFQSPLSSVEMYFSANDSWVSMPSLTTPRGDNVALFFDGYLHVLGGEGKDADTSSHPIEDVEVFDPALSAWRSVSLLVDSRFRFAAALIGRAVFVYGGQGILVGPAYASGSYYPVLSSTETFFETINGTVTMPPTTSTSTTTTRTPTTTSPQQHGSSDSTPSWHVPLIIALAVLLAFFFTCTILLVVYILKVGKPQSEEGARPSSRAAIFSNQFDNPVFDSDA